MTQFTQKDDGFKKEINSYLASPINIGLNVIDHKKNRTQVFFFLFNKIYLRIKWVKRGNLP